MTEMWTRPIAEVQQFAANEYVAACWTIKCNVPSGYGYVDTNNNGKRDNNEPKIASGHGCGTEHEANGISAAGPSANAMWHESYSSKKDYPVFYFQAKGDGWGTSNHHFCTLDSVNWKPNPNAS